MVIPPLWWYFSTVYGPYIKKTLKDFETKANIPSIPAMALAQRNPGFFGLNGGFGPLHKAAENNDIGTTEFCACFLL